jgi:hypothetical protein
VSAEEIECAAGVLQLLERDDLLNHKSFETIAARGRGQQLIRGTDSEQVMKNAAVAQIDFGYNFYIATRMRSWIVDRLSRIHQLVQALSVW